MATDPRNTDPQNTPLRPSDLPKLLAGYFNGTLDAGQLAELDRWVQQDPANADAFARYAIEQRALENTLKHARVGDLADLSVSEFEPDTVDPAELELVTEDASDGSSAMAFVLDQALAERRKHELEDEANRQLAAQQAEDERNRRFEMRRNAEPTSSRRVVVIPKAIVWLGLAAVLGLVVWIGNLALPDPPVAPVVIADPVEPANPVDPQPASPPPARLLASHRVVWTGGADRVGTDGALASDTYGLDDGFLQIEMADGATLIIEGPAEFTIDSAAQVSLSRGVLSAYIPEGAEGFIVDTPAGRVLDLGTEFGVEVLDDALVEVHVMQGRVVASLPEDGETRSMHAGDAGRLDLLAAQIEPVSVHSEKFARDWGQAVRAVRVEGALRYLYETPSSLRQGSIESDELFYLLPERRGVVLAESLVCDYATAGIKDRVPTSSAGLPSLPAGTVVDSFLLHYDRIGTPTELAAVQGVIHFDRPVVGILVDDRRLAATDPLFRNNQALYPAPTDVTRGLEGREHESNLDRTQDVVELSADMMTLTVRLSTSTGIDQLRVLVEADSVEVPTE